MRVIINHGHHTNESELLDTDLYCPNCGEKNVKNENSEGDYYVGEVYYCLSCLHNFTIQGPGENGPSVTFEP